MATNEMSTTTRRRNIYVSGLVIRVFIALLISWLIVMAIFITNVASHYCHKGLNTHSGVQPFYRYLIQPMHAIELRYFSGHCIHEQSYLCGHAVVPLQTHHR